MENEIIKKELVNMESLKLTVKEKIKFNFSVKELNEMVDESKKIELKDFNDDASFKIVVDQQKKVRKVAKNMEDHGVEARRFFRDINDEIMLMQRDLTGIIEPEIERLKAIIKSKKEFDILEERKKILPWRKEELAKVGDKVEISDDELLTMEDEDFKTYLNQRISDKLEVDRLEIEAEKERLANEKRDEEIRKQALEDAEIKAVNDKVDEARNKLNARIEKVKALGLFYEEKTDAYIFEDLSISNEQVKSLSDENFGETLANIKNELTSRKVKANEEKANKEKEDEEKAEKERLEKKTNYKNWLFDNGWKKEYEDNFKITKVDNEVRLYKLVSKFEVE